MPAGSGRPSSQTKEITVGDLDASSFSPPPCLLLSSVPDSSCSPRWPTRQLQSWFDGSRSAQAVGASLPWTQHVGPPLNFWVVADQDLARSPFGSLDYHGFSGEVGLNFDCLDSEVSSEGIDRLGIDVEKFEVAANYYRFGMAHGDESAVVGVDRLWIIDLTLGVEPVVVRVDRDPRPGRPGG